MTNSGNDKKAIGNDILGTTHEIIENKLGENKWKDGAKALNRLRKKVGANPAARNPKPEFMAVIVGAGEAARYDKEEDVYIIPLTALGA